MTICHKLLKPEFMTLSLITKQQEDEIFQLIHSLIQTLQSPEIAIDERHTPRLHARFLTGLLSRYKRDVATAGRLHTQPPPSQEAQFSSDPTSMHQPAQGGQTQQVFSVAPQAPTESQGMGTSRSSPDSAFNEPVYEPEAAYTADAGQVLDFDTSMSSEDDVLGALRILKTQAYWSDMMTPGYGVFSCSENLLLTLKADSKTNGGLNQPINCFNKGYPASTTASTPTKPLVSYRRPSRPPRIHLVISCPAIPGGYFALYTQSAVVLA